MTKAEAVRFYMQACIRANNGDVDSLTNDELAAVFHCIPKRYVPFHEWVKAMELHLPDAQPKPKRKRGQDFDEHTQHAINELQMLQGQGAPITVDIKPNTKAG